MGTERKRKSKRKIEGSSPEGGTLSIKLYYLETRIEKALT